MARTRSELREAEMALEKVEAEIALTLTASFRSRVTGSGTSAFPAQSEVSFVGLVSTTTEAGNLSRF